jgi:hypothetical protein
MSESNADTCLAHVQTDSHQCAINAYLLHQQQQHISQHTKHMIEM